tara:strand:+ start:275 stop:562 length:288 start_codon:yes stop_codon:yes gene_type:complete
MSLNLDFEAIYKAYSNAVTIDDDRGVFDASGNPITLNQSLIDAARVELDKLNYQIQRKAEYPDWGTQLDYIYHHGIDKWKTDIVDPVKKKYPKPE